MADVGSATKEGPDWWMASDRRWYPPELHPNAKKAPVAAKASPATAAQMPRTQRSSAPTGNPATARSASPPAGFQTATPQQPVAQPAAASQQHHAMAANTAVASTASGSPNRLAGMVGLAGSLLTIVGSFLTWAVDNGRALAGFEPVDVAFSGFQSNGTLALIAGVVALIASGLLIAGVRPGWVWGIVALLAGAAVIAILFFSYLDITGSASADWSNQVGDASDLGRLAASDAGVGLRTSIGFWVTGLGALILAVVPPFLRRD